MCADSDSPGSDVDCCCSRGSKAQRFKMAFQCTPTRARTQVHMYQHVCVYISACVSVRAYSADSSHSLPWQIHTHTHRHRVYIGGRYESLIWTVLCNFLVPCRTNKQTNKETNKQTKQATTITKPQAARQVFSLFLVFSFSRTALRPQPAAAASKAEFYVFIN